MKNKLNESMKMTILGASVVIYSVILGLISSGYWLVTLLISLSKGVIVKALLSVIVMILSAIPAIGMYIFCEYKLKEERSKRGDSDE